MAAFGACDNAFDLVHVPSHDGGALDDGDVLNGDAIGDDAAIGPTVCVDDDFSGTSFDPVRWTTYGAAQGVNSSIVSGVAEISVPASTTSAQDPYGGFYTKRGSFVGTGSQAELVQVAQGVASDVSIQLTIDSGNLYNITVNGGVLKFGKVVGTTPMVTSIAYSATNHRVVRMRHDIASNEMVFEAASAATPFTELGRTPADVSLANAYFEIYAGSYDVAEAFVARIDNVGTCTGQDAHLAPSR